LEKSGSRLKKGKVNGFIKLLRGFWGMEMAFCFGIIYGVVKKEVKIVKM